MPHIGSEHNRLGSDKNRLPHRQPDVFSAAAEALKQTGMDASDAEMYGALQRKLVTSELSAEEEKTYRTLSQRAIEIRRKVAGRV